MPDSVSLDRITFTVLFNYGVDWMRERGRAEILEIAEQDAAARARNIVNDWFDRNE